MDSMAVDNADHLLAIVERHPQVRGLLWGHIHQEFDHTRRGVRFLGSPSTCIQFIPNKHGFGVDSAPPGYRWLILQPDGHIRTGIQRLASVPGQIDLASGGY
jgi:Icc protein